MKIAIVSDTHNNWANFKKAIDWIKKEKIQMILHCGDIASQETIDDAKKEFGGEMRFVKGNADHGLDYLPEKMELELENPSASSGRVKIGFCHFPDIAKKMAQSGKFDSVFYGHTHRPWDEKIGECHMINPGELAGQFYKASFAIYDIATGKLELKILEKL
jgi:hypothetical protein